MDIVLTGMDGFAVMEQINRLNNFKKPNMLILSANHKEFNFTQGAYQDFLYDEAI